jgi:hypothetical protein
VVTETVATHNKPNQNHDVCMKTLRSIYNSYTKDYAPSKGRPTKLIVVGSGIAGLGCARQLVNLFRHNADRFPEGNIPEVIVLEGRDRIGGRTNSRRLVPSPIADGSESSLSSITSSPTKVSPVFEEGARFVHGVDTGDPLVQIIKYQLKLNLSQVSNDRLLLSGPSSRKRWYQENEDGYRLGLTGLTS